MLASEHVNVKLKAAATSTRGADAPLSLPKCSHDVTLGRPVGHGSCAVVFSVERVETSEAKPLSRTELVAKVGMSGEDSCESSLEAKILSSLPRHINIVGFYGNFCTVERNEDLEVLLGNFARRTLSRKRQARSVTKSAMARKEEMQRIASEVSATMQASELDVLQPLLHNFSLFEKCSLSLKDLLRFQTLTESELACAMSDVFRGLAFVHKHGVLHRDLTDGNLLIAEGGLRVVLADFDLSVETQGSSQVPWTCGTPGFMAPEVLKNGRGCAKSDIFGAGVIAFSAACGKHPFWREDIQDVQDAARATLHDEPDFWGGHVLRRSSKCLGFVEQLLQKQVDDRPTAKQALCDPWLLSGAASSNLCAAMERYNKVRSEEDMEEEQEEIPRTRSIFRRAVHALLSSTRTSETKPSKDSVQSGRSVRSVRSAGSFWKLWRKRGDVKFSQISPA